MEIKSVGSICSGIGAAAYAWDHLNFKWFSEIEEFQSNVLKNHYPEVPNLGDMVKVPNLLKNKEVPSVDLICGGTPCQAFSLAGLSKGLDDERGNLTLEFIKVVEENDKIRLEQGKDRSIVLWENVTGVLSDKTNAFGSFLAGLAGFDEPIKKEDISKSGTIKGAKRNIAWRILDAKFFGVPQQRRRVFLMAGDTNFKPENILFEESVNCLDVDYPKYDLFFTKDESKYEVFREYTDTLYSAYGTKWNGNAAAYNGSLFVKEDDELRRLSPLECERLMGFPDDYTNIPGSSRTKRYQGTGNSWAVPVVKWIGEKLLSYDPNKESILNTASIINTSVQPNHVIIGHMIDIVSPCDIKPLYLSPVATAGILRRSEERGINMNESLRKQLMKVKKRMSDEKINKKSRTQKRGRFSQPISNG